MILSNYYDCLIITQTFNEIDDYESAIKEVYRILKPGGTLLVTLPTISPAWNLKIHLWRFTVDAAKYVFSKYFKEKVEAVGLGNKQSALAFWQGFAVEDVEPNILNFNDPAFPLIVGVRAVK